MVKLKIPGKEFPELLLYSSYSFFNVTEVRDSDFKNAFPGIFNFTVGILGPLRWVFDRPNQDRTKEFV